MDKKKAKPKAPPVSGFLARFRGLLQACAALLTNPHLPNLLKGQIYRGKGKYVCVPGLNCYSCPAATGACPIGAIQSVIGSSKFRFSYYVTGTLILLGDTSMSAASWRALMPMGFMNSSSRISPG